MPNSFDPDAYLAQKAPAASQGFDPDAYLAAKDPQTPVNKPGGLWAALTRKDLDSAPKYDLLAQGARLGQIADKGNQEYAALIAKYGNRVGNAIEGAVPGSVGKAVGNYVRDTGNIDSTALSTASKFLLPQNRLGVASYAVEPLMEGYQALKGPKTGISKPGVVAKLGQMKTKVAAGDIQQAIDDPSVFQAPSVAEANAQYGQSMGPLQGAAKSLRQQTGKTLLGEADWNEAINRPGRILAGTEMTDAAAQAPEAVSESDKLNRSMGLPPPAPGGPSGQVPVKMDPQTALEGVQSINRFMRNKVNTAKLDPEQIGELLAQKEQLTQFLEQNGTPGMRAAAKVLRKAHVSENLGRIAPVNKSGGTDVLRSMVAAGEGATAASHALSGNVLGAVPYAFDAVAASPAMLGGAIRNYHSLSNPQVMGAASRAAVMSPALKALLLQRGQDDGQ